MSVVVVGGGLAGLSTALFLAWHRVPVVLVERRAHALRHPRARAVNNRTMELYRRVGLGPSIQAARSHDDDAEALLVRAGTLAGPEVWRRPATPPGRAEAASPCPWGSIDQDRLEHLVRCRAEQLGADVRFGTALRSARPERDGVSVVVAGPAGPATLRARYLVAADGGRSDIRTRLGIGMTGPGVLGDVLTFVFEAELTRPLRGRRVVVAHLEQPRPGTVILPYDGERRWVFSTPYVPAADGAPEDLRESDCVELVRAAVGVPDLAVRLLPQLADGTRVLAYQIGASVADRFRDGPMFLVGDAAHVLPPAGAFGASTGVQDAHNLAWKLAAVLRGDAGEALLSTYDAERRHVARFTLEQALLQMRDRTGRPVPGSSGELIDYDAVVLGYRYPTNGGPAAVPAAYGPDRLRGQPGTRAPHVPVILDGERVSSIDLYGPEFVLIAGPAGGVWAEAAQPLCAKFPLRVLRIGGDLADGGVDFCAAHALPEDGAILVRPDGFVAWRAEGPGGSPAGDLAAALDAALCRGEP
jgi:2-polyprenyl-6-methoxyphenol hydroxylase-like FAD-dependent oxidoreductase